jgi:hypothetical protein
VRSHIEGMWRRAELLRRHRDEHLARLIAVRDAELQRVQTREDRRVAQEATRWRQYAGGRSVRDDCVHLSRLGLSPDESAAHMRQYYLQGGPSQVLSPSRRPLPHSSRAPAEETCGPTFRGVNSYADYAARWREAYASHVDAPAHPRHTPTAPRYDPGSSFTTPTRPEVRPSGPVAGSLATVFARDIGPPGT